MEVEPELQRLIHVAPVWRSALWVSEFRRESGYMPESKFIARRQLPGGYALEFRKLGEAAVLTLTNPPLCERFASSWRSSDAGSIRRRIFNLSARALTTGRCSAS